MDWKYEMVFLGLYSMSVVIIGMAIGHVCPALNYCVPNGNCMYKFDT